MNTITTIDAGVQAQLLKIITDSYNIATAGIVALGMVAMIACVYILVYGINHPNKDMPVYMNIIYGTMSLLLGIFGIYLFYTAFFSVPELRQVAVDSIMIMPLG